MNAQSKIAVFDPVGEDKVSDEIKTLVREEITSTIVDNPNYIVLERANIDKVMEENKFQGKFASESEMSELGKMMGADYVCVITVINTGTLYYIFCKQVDVKNAVVENQGEGNTSSLKELLYAAKESALFFAADKKAKKAIIQELKKHKQGSKNKDYSEILNETSSNNRAVQEAIPAQTAPTVRPTRSEPHAVSPSLDGSIFLMPGVSVGKTLAYSIMVGYADNWGGYARFRFNFASKGEFVKGGKNDAFYDNAFVRSGRTSFTAGLMKSLSESAYIYVGGGYGSKWVQWETISQQRVEISELTYSGTDIDLGVIFKIGNFAVGGGVNALIGEQINPELNLSIGLTF
jgi:hypothetical protein